MILASLALFALAALLGATLLSFVLRDKPTPKGLLFLHGGMAAAGLLLLIVYTFGAAPKPYESLVLFLLAASGGFFMGIRDLLGKKVPKWLAVGHGLLALAGFGFLLFHAFH
ncbi:MAG TPA: hypothetical protein VJR29_07535 [bacterium]|nr:hypothetical protein [bacterium]